MDERFAKHFKELEEFGLLPPHWFWEQDKVRELKRIVSDLVELCTPHKEELPEIFENLERLSQQLNKIEVMIKEKPSAEAQKGEADSVNSLIAQTKNLLPLRLKELRKKVIKKVIASNVDEFIRKQDDPEWRAKTIGYHMEHYGVVKSKDEIIEELRRYKEHYTESVYGFRGEPTGSERFQELLDALQRFDKELYEALPHDIGEMTNSINQLSGNKLRRLGKIYQMFSLGFHHWITSGAVLVPPEIQKVDKYHELSLHDPALYIVADDEASAEKLFSKIKEACLEGGSIGLNMKEFSTQYPDYLAYGTEIRLGYDGEILSGTLTLQARKSCKGPFASPYAWEPMERTIKQLEAINLPKDENLPGFRVQSFRPVGWDRLKPVMKYIKDKNVSFVLSNGKSMGDVVAYHVVGE